MFFETPILPTLLLSLPGLAAIFTLGYTILKDAKSRRLKSYLKAVWGLSEKSPAARSACIFTLQSYVDSFRLFRAGRERQKRIIQVLATHLLTESDRHVRSLCSQAIAASTSYLRSDAFHFLHDLNQTVWNDCNVAALGKGAQLEKTRGVLDGITDTLIRLLKQSGPNNVNLRGVHLDFSNLDGVDLRGCDLTEATITNATLIKPKVEGAIFDRAIIINSYLTDLDLGDISLRGAVVCNCRFERVTCSANVRQQTRLFAGNFADNNGTEDTTGGSIALKEREPQHNMPEELYRSTELDWTAIWIPLDDTKDVLKAEWRSPYQVDSVTAEMVKLEEGLRFVRRKSNDGNDGQYSVEKRGWIKANKIEYVCGSRTLKTDVKNWNAVRWVMNSSNMSYADLRRGTTN
jgi:uncharacterized protein YjbI with pentapeptide repeats